MAKPTVEIILKATDQASKVFKETGKSASSMGKDLLKVGATFAGTAVAAGLAAKALFEFGKAGAEVQQTGESFDLLTEKVGLSSDLLEQLQDASKGTISDMELMSSTSLLLAGTSGELATALGESTPQLLEIAKAAQKLNPALGDTTFLYDSLARGIKRSSPLILDNLGLVISVGDANEKYAESIGKAVDQLTVEEEKMALLNATLEAGGVLIDQVGGSTDSAVDSFTRLETAIKNMADTAKKKATPALSDLADVVFRLLTADERWTEELKELNEILFDTGTTYDDYIERNLELLETQGKLDLSLIDQSRSLEDVATSFGLYSEEMFDAVVLGDTLTDSWMRMGIVGEETAEVIAEAVEDITILDEAILGLAGSYDAAKTASGLFGDSISILSDDLMDAERMKLTLKLLTEDLTQAEIEELLTTQQQLERLTELNQAFEDGTAGKEEFYSIVADGVITEDELNAALGRTADAAEDAVPKLDDLAESAGEVTKDAGAAEKKVSALALAIDKLHDKTITITTNFVTTGGGGGGDGFPVSRRQHGGPVIPGGAYVVGERGPELFVPNTGGNVVSNEKSGGVGGDVTIVNQYFNEAAAAIGAAEMERIWANEYNSFMGG